MIRVTIPFHLPGFEIDHISTDERVITFQAHSSACQATCPSCSMASGRVHSYYTRHPHDLPLNEFTVQLELRVRRFRCLNPSCTQHTFAERLPDVVAGHAQRTARLTARLAQFGLALGGEAGARLAKRSNLSTSPDTVLRVVRQLPAVAGPTPRVLGVDDWAFRKGRKYGTILIDLERHRPIDLLPDRSAETLAQWLETHPGVEIIRRDRSTEYARGATVGAPDAIQVADRWHLLQNLREALERLLHCLHARLRRLPPLADARGATSDPVAAPHRPYRRAPSEEALREMKRERRRARYREIKALQAHGMNILQIATQLKMSRVTVRRYFKSESFPERARSARGPSLLDPFKPYLAERWQAGCDNGLQLWRELREQGFTGSRKLVAQWVQARRSQPAPTTPKRYLPDGALTDEPVLTTASATPALAAVPAPRQLVWLLLRAETALTHPDQETLRFIRQDPDVERAYDLGQQFLRLVRQRSSDTLSDWLTAAATSGIEDLQTFATGLQREYASIEAALQLPWSQGQTEGQINRLKMLKRQMYGRANFDLLRQRVLLAA